ncbi:hypothetical protein ACF0H5_013672 [Mactra antiquata]
MTKLRRLELILTNPQMIYFPGQAIQGQVLVELNEDMKMRGVRAQLQGKGHIYWSEGSGDNRRTYSASETYVETRLILFGQDSSSGNDTVLTAGNHMFPFQFVLPLGIPGSFEGKSSCYVRYTLKAIIDRPWKFDPEFKMLISVGSVLDLNTVQNAMAPQQCTDSKTVCCCCCESSPITATFRIDKTGYVPGEPIICNAEINEGTGRGVHSSVVKLVMQTTYRTHGGSKTRRTNEIARLQHGSIAPGETDVWNGERLVIPPVPPSYLPGCNIIIIDYFLKLSIDVADTPIDLDLPLPVIIGSIPVQSVINQYMPQLPPNTMTNQPLGFQAPVNFDMPPPSYQECVLGKVDTTDADDKHATGNMSFAPAYSYYDWMSHPGPSASSYPPPATTS